MTDLTPRRGVKCRESLTPRQLAVAALVHAGMPPKKIATRLGIARNTLKVHMRAAAARIGGDGPPIVVLTRYYERFHAAALDVMPER